MSKGGATTRTQAQQRAYDVVKAARRQGMLHIEGRCQHEVEGKTRGCCKPARELHHDDYAKPLDVKFYCATHNRIRGKGSNA